MASILDKLRGTLKRASNSTADLESALTDAQRAEVDAIAAVEAQAAAVAANFLDAEPKRERDRGELERLRLAASDAAAIRAEVERRHAAALEADEDGRRQAVYADAKRQADAAARSLAVSYPKLCQGLVAMLRDLAEAQIAVAEANAALPSGASPIEDPEMVARSVPGLPREIVSDEWVEAWGLLGELKPVSDEYQSQVYSLDRDGKPSGWGRMQDNLEPCYRLRRFHKITYRDYTNGQHPLPIAASLVLPSVRGDGMFWGDSYAVHNPALTMTVMGQAEPGAVLERISAIDAAAAARPVKAERPLRIEYPEFAELVPFAPAQPLAARAGKPSGTGSAFGASPFAPAGSRAGGRR